MDKKPVRILSNLARSGGTLASKCLGAMEGVVLLSEIHPGSMQIFNPLEQAQKWYGLLTPEEIQGSLSFEQAIQLIDQRCTETNKTLLIRDWAHLDFIGIPFLKNPGFHLQLTETLAKNFNVIQFALVRHPIDQWLSTTELDIIKGKLALDDFLAGYRKFAEQSVSTGYMRYEDFTQDPVPMMKLLCKALQLDFDEHFYTRWHNNNHVTGDTSNTSRGSKFTTIRPVARKSIGASLLLAFKKNPDYQAAIELLGYDDVTASG